jgi:hypothetical protein
MTIALQYAFFPIFYGILHIVVAMQQVIEQLLGTSPKG